jgi:ribosome biogenesis GTPase
LSVRLPASLAAIGLDDARVDEFAALGEALIPARVTRVDRGAVALCTPSGEARAPTRQDQDLAVGDFVAITPDGSIAHVLERHGAVARLVGHRHDTYQVVAANVDVVLVVRPLDLSCSAARVQSLLTLAYDSGATPVVVLTKADLVADVETKVNAVTTVAPGVEVIVASSVTGEGWSGSKRSSPGARSSSSASPAGGSRP